MKRSLILAGVSFGLLMIIFMATDAKRVPSPILMVPFVLLFVLISSLVSALLRWQDIAVGRSWRVGLVFAGVPIVLLILQSIGQLTIKDVLTIAVLLVVSYFYVSRSTVSS